MLNGLHRDVTAKKKLEVDTQILKHRVHQLGESFGQPQLFRDADLVIKHLLEIGAGPRAQSGEVLLQLDELKLTQVGGNLPRQEVRTCGASFITSQALFKDVKVKIWFAIFSLCFLT